jgi:phage gp16-like protein
MSAVRKPVSDRRKALYGKIEIGRKSLGLDDDTFRDLMEQRYGQRSRTKLRDTDLIDLVEHFKTLGFKPKRKAQTRTDGAANREVRKIRALWLSGYQLGVIEDSSEKALTAFARRVTGGKDTGIRSLAWLKGEAAAKVIEGLKDWLSREAGVDWSGYANSDGTKFHRPRCRILEAQWQILGDQGKLSVSHPGALDSYAARFHRIHQSISVLDLTAEQADELIRYLGKWIRRDK